MRPLRHTAGGNETDYAVQEHEGLPRRGACSRVWIHFFLLYLLSIFHSQLLLRSNTLPTVLASAGSTGGPEDWPHLLGPSPKGLVHRGSGPVRVPLSGLNSNVPRNEAVSDESGSQKP